MKNSVKAILIVLTAVIFSGAVYYFVVRCKPTKSEKYTAYVKGEEKQEYKSGQEITTVKKKTDHKQVKKPVQDSTINPDSSVVPFFFTDSSGYELYVNVTTYPGVDSVKLDFDLSYDKVYKTRMDTIYKIRIDTLKIETRVEKPQPFYNTFLFGAAVTSVVIAVAVLLTQ